MRIPFWIPFIFLFAACGHPSDSQENLTQTQKSEFSNDVYESYEARKFRQLKENLKKEGVQFVEWIMPATKNNCIHFMPLESGHFFNQLAFKLQESHLGLKLVYSPEDLGGWFNTAAAIFDSVNNILGISHEMVQNLVVDPAFAHEMVHADHLLKRRRGVVNGFDLVATLLKGSSVSVKNSTQHLRRFPFEELDAYLEHIFAIFDLAGDIEKLDDHQRKNMYESAQIAMEAAEAILELSRLGLGTTHLEIVTHAERINPDLVVLRTYVDSSEREIINSRTYPRSVKDGTLLSLFLSRNLLMKDDFLRDLMEKGSGIPVVISPEIALAHKLFKDSISQSRGFAESIIPVLRNFIDSFGYVLHFPEEKNMNIPLMMRTLHELKNLEVYRYRRVKLR